ncbi:MAG TPA: NAD(P)-dependent oxidoreductase [Rhizomicrobium sp.]|jgi:precorrin-2 dehydrogenase/sirohydrochlorin ferrochelatase|nr:NAD(P)-dependent oxidoreductase [Rhizomicrobium sp.]
MLPLVLNPVHIKVGLAGLGPARDRRAAMLADAGVEVRLLPEMVLDAQLEGLQVLFVAGLPDGEARDLAGRARGLGVLVNVEDVLPLCDFHVPAVVRRGELLLTASTGGRVPGLARALRERLADDFGPEWTGRLKELGAARAKWRSQGLSPHEVSEQVRGLIAQMGWL